MSVFLDLPVPPPELNAPEDQQLVFDPFRRKWLKLTPEEWVRQWVLKTLVLAYGFPAARIATEIPAKYHRLKKRSDALLFDAYGRCILVMEFKAPSVSVNEKTMHQALTYNAYFQAPNILLSNGITHLLWQRSRPGAWKEGLPLYEDLSTSP